MPSPTIFNHVIAQVIIDGETFWVDPTQKYQRGSVRSLYHQDFRSGLVIKPGVKDLETIPTQIPEEPQMFVNESLIFSDHAEFVDLVVCTKYRGEEADNLRYQLSQESRLERERQYLNFYSKRFPGISAQKAIEINDDELSNLLVISEHYRIPTSKSLSEMDHSAWAIVNQLVQPEFRDRKSPFSIPYPLYISHQIEFAFPSERKIKSGKLNIETSDYEFYYVAKSVGRSYLRKYVYTTLQDHVAPESIGSYLNDVRKMESVCLYGAESPLSLSPKFKKLRSPTIWSFIIISIFLAIISIKQLFFKVSTGREGLIGMQGIVREEITEHSGIVFVHGELWQARSNDNQVIQEGMDAVVVHVRGLILFVKKG